MDDYIDKVDDLIVDSSFEKIELDLWQKTEDLMRQMNQFQRYYWFACFVFLLQCPSY